MATGIPARLSPREGRRFGATVGAAFLALAGLLWWRGRTTGAGVFATVGGTLILAAILIPARLGPVQRFWMALGHAISRVTTPVVIAIMYFAVLTPFAALRRTFARSPLRRSSSSPTFWIERRTRRSDLTRQF